MVQAAVGSPTRCPRCTGLIFTGYDEPCCLQCGYVDYNSPVEQAKKSRSNNILNKGTEFILRYMGESQWLSNHLAFVKVVRVRNKVVFDLDCPFCGADMEQASASGHKKELKEERFKCADGHRISLIPSEEGVTGWK